MGIYLPHGATWVDEGVVAHVRGGKRLYGQVNDPVTEIVVASHEEAALLMVQCTGDE